MLKSHCLSPKKAYKTGCRSKVHGSVLGLRLGFDTHVVSDCVWVVFSQFLEFFVESLLSCCQTTADVGPGKRILGYGCTDIHDTGVGMRDHGSDSPGNARCLFGLLDVPALLCCWSGSHKFWSVKRLWICSSSGNDALKRKCSPHVYEMCLSKYVKKC